MGLIWIFGLFGWRRRRVGVVALSALALIGCTESETPVVDCTRMICSPDGAVADGGEHDAPHHEDDGGVDAPIDAGPVFPDAEVDATEPDPDTGPPACVGDAVVVEPGGKFCMNSCYCRSPEACFGPGEAASCCDDEPVCPAGGEPWIGCVGRDTIRVGDGTGCVHGQCFCMSDDHCYAEPTAAGCCAGEIVCF